MGLILIAEDDEGIHVLLSSIVTALNHTTVWTHTAQETLDFLLTCTPFLMILDYGLPDMNAQELITRLGNEKRIIPPFILSTGHGDERISVNMMKLGAREYVVKDTFFFDHFTEVIKRVCTELENENKLILAETSLHNSQGLLLGLFEQSPICIQVLDTNGVILNVNRAYEKFWGVSASDVNGILNIFDDPQAISSGFIDFIRPVFAGEVTTMQEFSFEPLLSGKPGTRKNFTLLAFPIKDATGIYRIVLLQNDISGQKQAEAQIYQLAFYDPLTGLPNRSLMIDRITQRLFFLQRHKQLDVLILLNIDRFKIINDARGNQIGDTLLSAIGVRIKSLMREADTVARMTADEFAILLPNDENNPEQVSFNTLAITSRICDSFRMIPFVVNGETFAITASLGITLLPEDENDTPGAVFRRSDTALHRAKDAGGNQSAFFETGMGESASENYQLERDLTQAVVNKELRLFLQKQVNAAGKVVGAECLLRWQHPTRNLLSPGLFIPIAEQSDLIIELGSWVMKEACAILAETEGPVSKIRISVNVSPRHFRKNSFVPWLTGLVARSGADPRRLTLEITESLFIGNLNDVILKMLELKELGIQFSIDDFGTGYSSLSYIKRLPIHELKIDKSFVQDALNDPNDAALVEIILDVATHLKLTVVAEGVETEGQAAFLNARGEIIHQGYLYGRPEPADGFLESLRNFGN